MSNGLVERARTLKPRLDAIKAELPRDFDWYPYDSLANVLHVEQLLRQAKLGLADLAGAGATADIGCGDGDFAFLLESLGFCVHAIDYPPSNHNGMRGVYALKPALRSAIEIHAVDIDGRFVLPADRYDVAFLMGVLYHLKNPFYALEALSKQVRYCFLSTRVAAVAPGSNLPIHDLPIAYLLDDDELNEDNSNFWILSEAGLRRLLRRTHWEVRAWFSAGTKSVTDPADRRAFCLARSHYAMAHLELLSGWHAPEEGGFRWTERRFSVRQPPGTARFILDFFLPDARAITLRACADGNRLEHQHYSRAGRHRYARTLPGAAARIDFELDRVLPPDDRDLRERGIIVTSLEFEP
ncbi:MAG: class I SAM-dependent methyltransferase [Bryobacteraceae bacterium]